MGQLIVLRTFKFRTIFFSSSVRNSIQLQDPTSILRSIEWQKMCTCKGNDANKKQTKSSTIFTLILVVLLLVILQLVAKSLFLCIFFSS